LEIEKQELVEIIATTVKETITQLGLVNANPKPVKEKSAYSKTEALLYNYRGFKRIVDERMAEIEDIKKYGVPQKGGAVVEYGGNSGGTPRGIVLPEESVDAAVRRVEASVQDTVQAIALIDRCMAQIKCDPYYNILEMLYFEKRTQEDVALEFKCAQSNISANKSRLVRALAMRMFTEQAVKEMIN
jgi:hypothetical protein